MYKFIILLALIAGISCNININLNFDPEKLEKAMDSFLDDIGYGKKDKKMQTLKLFSRIQNTEHTILRLLDILTLCRPLLAEEETELEKIKKEMKEIHQSLEEYYNNHIIGETLEGTIKIINERKVKDEEESKKLKSLVDKQNKLRSKFFKEFAKSNGKDTEEAIEQVKEAFTKKTIERAKENNWCREEKDENNNIKWVCE